MELRKFIATTIREYLNEQKMLNEASFHSFDNDDILNVIDFFSSSRSSYITAQILYLGGIN